jgi:hypothetical protein
MRDDVKQQQFDAPRQKEKSDLTAEESQMLEQFTYELEQEGWQQLRQTLGRMNDEQTQLQKEKAKLLARNSMLAAIAESQAYIYSPLTNLKKFSDE